MSATSAPGPLERALLALAVVGFVAPNAMVVAYFLGRGTTAATYLGSWFASLPSTQLFVDLAIVVAAFWLWSYADHRRAGTRHWWLVPATTVSVGICMAVPLHLWQRERARRLAGVTGTGGAS